LNEKDRQEDALDPYGEIVSVLTRIQMAVDHQDRETFADCWAQDVNLRIQLFDGHVLEFKSRDELVQGTTGAWSGQPSAMRHLVGAVDVRLDGADRARAHFYCSYYNVGAEPAFVGMGEYRDEMTRGADGRWRVQRRDHVFLTPLTLRLQA
jgi:hypothetical protein